MENKQIKELRKLLDSLPESVVFNIYSTIEVSYGMIVTVLFMRDGKMCLIDFRLINDVFHYVDKFITYSLRNDAPTSKAVLNEHLLEKLR